MVCRLKLEAVILPNVGATNVERYSLCKRILHFCLFVCFVVFFFFLFVVFFFFFFFVVFFFFFFFFVCFFCHRASRDVEPGCKEENGLILVLLPQ